MGRVPWCKDYTDPLPLSGCHSLDVCFVMFIVCMVHYIHYSTLHAMPLQPMEEWVVFLIMGSVLPGYMFRYQYCLVGGLEAIVFGSIRWCVWSFRPSSPLRLPHLKCLLLLYMCQTIRQPSLLQLPDRKCSNALVLLACHLFCQSLSSQIIILLNPPH